MKSYLDILRLVWPLALGMINNAVMQFVDRAYLARESMTALEAVLPAGILAWIFMSFFQSVIGYSGVFVAQFFGAKQEDRCLDCVRMAVYLALAAGALMLPCVPLGDFILGLTAPGEYVLGLERTYYDIIILGGVFIYLQMAFSSYFTGRGRTQIVFWVNLAGNLLNIALDPFLIFGWCGIPRLGIVGAAYATVISMAVQTAVLALAMPQQKTRRFDFALLMKILRYGIPAGLGEVLNMASFAIFVFITGGVGNLELAVSNACFTINYLLVAPLIGFSLGAQTLVGQARGRGDDEAAELAFRRTLLLALGFVIIAGGLTLIFHRPVLALFASGALAESRAAFHSLGLVLLVIMSAWLLFDAADIVVSGALKGAGDTRFVMLWMLFCAFVLWLPAVLWVRHVHNTMPALWLTMVGYVVVICAGSLIRWRCRKWRSIRLVSGT